jgi:hypothetical protein
LYETYDQLNFLLDPGTAPTPVVTVKGTVFTDLNGNGVQDAGEPASAGFTVYYDANKNGSKEAGEQSVVTDANGHYSITVTDAAISNGQGTKDTFQIGVVPPPGWTATNPNPALHSVYGGPGDTFTGADFGFQPPPGAVGEPGSPGSVLGILYNDRNANGTRDAGEEGLGGFHVYVDVNNSGTFDAGEPDATTDSGGAFFISNVNPGTLSVRADVGSPYVFTQPASGARIVDLPSGGAVSNVLFGVKNLATQNFGTLGAPYPTSTAENGPRHTIVPGFLLGSTEYGQIDGSPANSKSDDDGVVILDSSGNPGGSIHAGANTLQVTVQGVGGYLNAWIDWNGNGSWDDPGDKVFSDLHLNPGTYQLTVTAPTNYVGGGLAARFRWGSAGLSYTGPDIIGEVEDYRLANSRLAGDYNLDGSVNADDYNAWKSTFGQVVVAGTGADGNGDGVIDAADYGIWRDHTASSGSGAGAFSQDEIVEGAPPAPTADQVAAHIRSYLANFNSISTPAAASQLATLYALWGLDPTDVLAGKKTHIPVALDANNWGTQSGGSGIASSGLSTTTPAVATDGAALATSSIPVFPSLQLTASVDTQTAAAVFASPVVLSSSASDAKLLLLDQALADLGGANAGDQGQIDPAAYIACDRTENDRELSDLALAAAFDNDTDWRSAI